MAVMVELAADAGSVVARDSLLERVWKSDFVGDDVISRCVYCLRGHLEGASGEPGYRDAIKTLPRRGYRLELEAVPIVEIGISPGAEQGPSHHLWRPLLMAAFLAAIALLWWHGPLSQRGAPAVDAIQPAIAVLPFADLSADGSQRHIAEGVADAMISKLAYTLPIQVIARSSSFAVGALALDAEQIASRLGVTHFVEGSVRQDGPRIIVSARLVEAESASALWSRRWDIEISDLAVIERSLAEAVAQELGLETGVLRDGEAPVRPESAEAFVDYLYARLLIHRRLSGDLETAVSMLERVLEAQPGFVDGWAALASARWLSTMEGAMADRNPSEESLRAGLEGVRRTAETAISLDPRNAEALLRLASAMRRLGHPELAVELFDRARANDPSNPTLLAMEAGKLARRERLDDAIRLLDEALQLDPLATVWRSNLALYLLRAGQPERAWSETERILPMMAGDPRVDRIREIRALIRLAQNRPEEALAESGVIEDPLIRAHCEALALSALGGDASGAMDILRNADDVPARLKLAEVLAVRGDHDAAVREVTAAAEQWHAKATPMSTAFLQNWVEGRHLLVPLKNRPDWPGHLIAVDAAEFPPEAFPIRD
ncbi:tetratricopeptide repeat protein [Wenzhouxiangella sp. XN79A]|uniref:tetratricopeptide repeat protein n=1 Tax=Wenzhouxiangella sp. XN79A TaxID=2724193 RepID=UPI00144A6B42|nr:tetratricopeptide repeat protein [Wenzhouxiangella sp. XN79A]NKI34168.1 tetratricopeptide repeat protein [Wenzhouxiangella sp. XN79A]